MSAGSTILAQALLDRRLFWIISAVALIVLLVLGIVIASKLAGINSNLTYLVTISLGDEFSRPLNEVAEERVADFAKYQVAHMGTVQPDTVEEVINSVANRFHPDHRGAFRVSMADEIETYIDNNISIFTGNTRIVKQMVDGKRYKYIVRAKQVLWGGSGRAGERTVDIPIEIVPMSIGGVPQYWISSIQFAPIYSVGGEIKDALLVP